MKLFIAGLPEFMDNLDLEEMFELYGPVASSHLVMDRSSGKNKGFGFVEFAKKADGLQAIQVFKGKTIYGRPLIVQAADESGKLEQASL